MDLKKWEEKNTPKRGYAHFDKRVSLKKFKTYIYNKEKIKTHSFYPFIYSEIVFKKYSEKEEKKRKIKTRPICYSSHKDRLIFSYYSFLLNSKYNDFVEKEGINENIIAYRTNLKKCNIDFAKKAFDFIKKTEKATVMVGDFTSFFDNLDHRHLKNMLCKVLNCEKLDEDWYSIYKNITKYSCCTLENILELKKMEKNREGILSLNKQEEIFTNEEFREYKKSKKLKVEKNSEEKGIPQGSAISAVLSNVYMVDYDKRLNSYATEKKGLYLRYSDDFIVIIPDVSDTTDYIEEINKIISSFIGVELQKEKTQIFNFENRSFGENKKLDYLGFTFDGKKVSIRDKTVTKYYYRMYRKIKPIVKSGGVIRKTGKRISCRSLYETYSVKGAKVDRAENKFGNFITYVKRANKKFCGEEKPIKHILNIHMKKIRKRLDRIEK